MKRVHNDHGSAGASPTGAAQQATKGRKRKSDAEAQGSPSRKASIKSMPAPEPKQPPVKPLIEQWLEQRKALETFVQRMDKPDLQSLQHIAEAQKHLEIMVKMATDATTVTPKTEMQTGRRYF